MPSVRSATNSEDEDSDAYDDSEDFKPTSSYGQDDLSYDDEHPNIILSGPGKKTPILQFKAEYLVNKDPAVRQVGDKFHLSFILTRGDCKIVRSILHAHGLHESHPNSPDFNIMWTSSQVKPYVLRSLTEFQRINHFPRSYEITRKDRLFKNVQRMQQIKGMKHFDIVPTSYVMPGEFQEFCAAFLKDKGPYIVKPIALSRGRGIYLCNHPEQIQLDEQLIVCKYISNPFLIDGFKFDIRLYVAVTSYDPLIIYLYEEGLARFATMKYDANPKTLRQQCMHLTNYSINKRNENFVHNDDADVEDYGNKWSLGALLRYLKSVGKDVTALMMRIEDVVVKAILSVEMPISTACRMFQPYRGNCFELYGFDIILDDTLRPWLLEVNLSPSLACDAPIDFKIKSHMVCDLLTLIGLPCHDPVLRVPLQSRKNVRSPFPRPNSGPHSVGPVGRPPTGSKIATSKRPGTALTMDEQKMIRRAREEHSRRAGWTRIFPTRDSWEVYSSFFQSSTSSNFLLHQKLFGEASANVRNTTVVSKTKIPLHSLSTSALSLSLASSAEHHRRVTSVYEAANDRLPFYERRLGSPTPLTRSRSLPSRRRPPQLSTISPSPSMFRGNLVQPDTDSEDDTPAAKRAASVENLASRVAEKLATRETDENPEEPEKEKPVEEVPVETVPSDLVRRGGEMSKLQARLTFGAYLTRVQQRLMVESRATHRCSPEEMKQACEQIDLVLRFLRRASDNLHQDFRVQIPSRKLPLAQRKRILAKLLSDFIAIYAKETEHMRMRGTEKEAALPEVEFGDFLRLGSEAELESILTSYTHANKSAGIFINACAEPRLVRSSSTDSGVFIKEDGIGESEQISNSRLSLQRAALAYSTRLSRPASALSLRPSNSSRSRQRPASASMARHERVPVVETYDEAAINAALHKLAVKQQTRQYAASKVSSVLRQRPTAYQHRQYQGPEPEDRVQNAREATPERRPRTNSVSSDLAERIRAEYASRPPSRSREFASSQVLLHQFRQSKALLEQSRAKHDAMLAQVGVKGNTVPQITPKPPSGPRPAAGNHSRSAIVKLNTGLQQSSPPMLKLTFASAQNSRF